LIDSNPESANALMTVWLIKKYNKL